MNEHPYGEKVLDSRPPPYGATGLIIREQVYKDEVVETPILGKLFGKQIVKRYFIFRVVVGSHDYFHYGETRCGSYRATMGYWHYATKEERDVKYEQLLADGYTEY